MENLDNPNNRFKSLIQPIKDLASNWDIDIAESLNDYLEELESLRISLDGGQTQLNFAEAALLIQGSTAVYSKKVEYLHQLVLKSLEYITNKKSSKEKDTRLTNSTNGNSDGVDISGGLDDDDLLEFGKDISFLLLDHVVEAGQNIDLKTLNNNLNPDGKRYSTESGRNSNNATNMSRVSISLMHSMLTEDHGTTSLKLASSFMDNNGALLLGGFRPSFAKPTAALDRSLADVSAIGVINMSREDHNMSMSRIIPESEQYDEPQLATEDVVVENYYDSEGDHFMDYGGDHQEIDEETKVPLTVSANLTNDPTIVAVHPVNQLPSVNGIPSMQQSMQSSKKSVSAPQQRTYVMLDPHVVVPGSRAARKGRPYKIPPALLDSTYELDYPATVIQDLESKSILWTGAVPTRGLSNLALLPLLKLKRKLHRKRLDEAEKKGDFEYIANQSMQKHLWEEPQTGLDDIQDDVGHDDQLAVEHQEEQEMEIMYGANDFGDVEYDVCVHEDEKFAVPGMGPDDQYFAEEELARRVDAALSEDLHRNNGQSYEMICKQYIEGFHRGANAFARETQLSKRVTEWTMKLEPILQAQEDATPFDIHDYSGRVLRTVDHVISEHQDEKRARLPNEIEKVSFSEVVEGESSAEVCRMFLACLQLANLGNVIVESNINKDGTVTNNDFSLRLITTAKKQDIESFRAPSVHTPVGVADKDEENEMISTNKLSIGAKSKNNGKGKVRITSVKSKRTNAVTNVL